MNYRQYFKQQFAAITKKDIELQDGFSVTELHAIENIFSSRPVALQEYYHLIGKHPINKEHNRILAPNEIYYIGDYLVFAEENENVVVWRILKSDLRIEDPVVYQGQEYNGKYSWYSEDSTFSRFVIQMFKWQVCAQQAPWVKENIGDRVLKRLEQEKVMPSGGGPPDGILSS